MPHGGPSATRRPVKVRRSAGGNPYRPAGLKPARKKKKLGAFAALILLLFALGIGLIVWAFHLPQQEETPAPSQYRQSMSIHPESSAEPWGGG